MVTVAETLEGFSKRSGIRTNGFRDGLYAPRRVHCREAATSPSSGNTTGATAIGGQHRKNHCSNRGTNKHWIHPREGTGKEHDADHSVAQRAGAAISERRQNGPVDPSPWAMSDCCSRFPRSQAKRIPTARARPPKVIMLDGFAQRAEKVREHKGWTGVSG